MLSYNLYKIKFQPNVEHENYSFQLWKKISEPLIFGV
jgi:hypothetical protein